MRRFFPYDVNGKEFADGFIEGEGVIFCSNHQSHLDGPIISSILMIPVGQRRFLGFIGSGKAMQENFLYKSLTLIGGIPIFKKNPNPTLNYVTRSLKEGLAVLITPQGRRIHRTPFHDYFNLAEEGRTGVGRVVLNTNGKIPVVPVYIRGTSEVLKPGSMKMKFGSYISISFGKPIFFNQYSRQVGRWSESDSDYSMKAREITDTIMSAIRDILFINEKPYFDFLEWKLNTQVGKIVIPPNKEKEFVNFLRKLTRIPTGQIQQYLDSKSN
jgi:1-acyl-sn-glycerol-3-phosphate acyltransferase